jgi:hypothetical protein
LIRRGRRRGSDDVAAILSTVKVRAVADPDARVSARELALGLPKHDWRTITWPDGSADPLRSRFARVRVRTASIRGDSLPSPMK